MTMRFNYRHLYYFLVVAREGGIARAAARLDMAVQTVSAQVRELERALGQQLLKPAGRGVALTDAGQAAVRQADQIFQLGEQLPEIVQRSSSAAADVRLVVGMTDALPKLVVHSLMEPILHTQALRLICHVDEFDDLLADLALHRLDVVLADHGPPTNPNLKLYGHPLGSSPIAWYAASPLAAAAQRGFPDSLGHVPILLPSHHAAVRLRLDHWFERQGLHPRIVGEFEDSALLKAFGASGMGVFPAATRVHEELVRRYGVRRIGPCDSVEEHYFAISAERRVQHPLVQRLLAGPDMPAQRPALR